MYDKKSIQIKNGCETIFSKGIPAIHVWSGRRECITVLHLLFPKKPLSSAVDDNQVHSVPGMSWNLARVNYYDREFDTREILVHLPDSLGTSVHNGHGRSRLHCVC